MKYLHISEIYKLKRKLEKNKEKLKKINISKEFEIEIWDKESGFLLRKIYYNLYYRIIILELEPFIKYNVYLQLENNSDMIALMNLLGINSEKITFDLILSDELHQIGLNIKKIENKFGSGKPLP